MGFWRNQDKDQYLGVDIGTSSLKIVEINKFKGRPNLLTYGAISLGKDIIRSEAGEVEERITESLIQIFATCGAKTKKAFASLPGFSVFTSMLKIPAMKEEEMSSAIKWEAKRYIPFPLEEMILDWEVVPGGQSPGASLPTLPQTSGQNPPLRTEQEIFLTAVPKSIVQRYSNIFRAAKLKLIGLEPEAMALARALVRPDEGQVMIVDIGATATEICIVADGYPKLNLSVDTGGNALTEAVARVLQVGFERAEQFKKDFGVSRDKLGGEIPKAIRPVIDVIVEKIRHCLDLFYKRGGGKVQKIILSGGSAKLPEFSSYLSLFLKEKIEIANPWRNILYPQELEDVLKELGPGFDVAIGLAQRELGG